MLSTTVEVIRAAMRSDPSIPPAGRARLLALLKSDDALPPTREQPTKPRLIRRAEVATRLSCSLRTVDNLAKAGLLPLVRLPGRIRGAGFREADVNALIEARQ